MKDFNCIFTINVSSATARVISAFLAFKKKYVHHGKILFIKGLQVEQYKMCFLWYGVICVKISDGSRLHIANR